MVETDTSRRLRVLVVKDQRPRLVNVDALLHSLGHDVIARLTEANPATVAKLTREYQPELAVVGLGDSDEHALDLIKEITHQSTCPVVVIVHRPNPDFIARAARHGVFACVNRDDPDQFRSAITIALERFASFRELEGAFGRRAQIERAKGILMERHQIDEREAFELIRTEARRRGRRVADVATAVNESHILLLARKPSRAEPDDQAQRHPDQPERP